MQQTLPDVVFMLLSPYHYNVFRQKMWTGGKRKKRFRVKRFLQGGKELLGGSREKAKKTRRGERLVPLV